jgi:hypothetical protein
MLTAAVQPPRFCSPIQQDNVANALSHIESDTAAPSYDALAVSQDSNNELQTLLVSNTALWLVK